MNAQATPAVIAGIEATEHVGTDRILKGNADIAHSESAAPIADARTCTLPMYPLQRDLPPPPPRYGGAA